MLNIEANSIINDYTLNIFTDASISKLPGTEIVTGGAGAQFYIGDRLIDSKLKILINTTNNQSELTAILLGVIGAIQLKNQVRVINLFSDSRISILGLREWIFSWVNSVHEDVMYSSSGLPVANQQIILNIVDAIIRNNLQINLYHVRGHLDSGKDKQVFQFKKSFLKENHLDPYTIIDDKLIQFLINGNSSIDKYTRDPLLNKEYMLQLAKDSYYSNPIIPFTIDPSYYLSSFNIGKYKECIGVC